MGKVQVFNIKASGTHSYHPPSYINNDDVCVQSSFQALMTAMQGQNGEGRSFGTERSGDEQI
jgi:hypothetical protein